MVSRAPGPLQPAGRALYESFGVRGAEMLQCMLNGQSRLKQRRSQGRSG